MNAAEIARKNELSQQTLDECLGAFRRQRNAELEKLADMNELDRRVGPDASEAVRADTIIPDHFLLVRDDTSGVVVTAPFVQTSDGTTIRVPYASLTGSKAYTLMVAHVRDLAGNFIAAPYAISFTTTA